jgi:hypothetical protein
VASVKEFVDQLVLDPEARDVVAYLSSYMQKVYGVNDVTMLDSLLDDADIKGAVAVRTQALKDAEAAVAVVTKTLSDVVVDVMEKVKVEPVIEPITPIKPVKG